MTKAKTRFFVRNAATKRVAGWANVPVVVPGIHWSRSELSQVLLRRNRHGAPAGSVMTAQRIPLCLAKQT